MKITGGKLKNRVIPSPKQQIVRPTSSKVREAIFSMIGQDLQGIVFLDAFGGSGVMAIEACSRGVESVWVSEKDPRVQRWLKRTFASFPISVTLMKKDAKQVIPMREWDIVFFDPPYAMDVSPFLRLAYESVRLFIIVETEKNTTLSSFPVEWERWKMKVYGNSKVTILRRKNG